MNYYQHQKLQHSTRVINKIPLTFSIKCYSIATIHPFTFFAIFIASKKAIFSAKFLSAVFGQLSKSLTMQAFTALVVQSFCYITKAVSLNCIPIFFPKYFVLGKKASFNEKSLDLNKLFDFQPRTKSVSLYSLNSNSF